MSSNLSDLALQNNATAQPVHGNRGVKHEPQFFWYERLLFLAVVVAALCTVDPTQVLNRNGLTKHAVLVPTAMALFFFVVRRGFGYRRIQTIIGYTWPWLLLAAIILAGSLYMRFTGTAHSTFLAWGLYMPVVAIFAQTVLETRAVESFMKYYMSILLVAGAFMALLIIGVPLAYQSYHTEIFLVIPLAIYFIAGPYKPMARWLGFVFFVGVILFAPKNTAYLVTLLTLAYPAWFIWRQQLRFKPAAKRASGFYALFAGAALMAVAVAFVVKHHQQYLPTGNVTFRTYLYALAWQRFEERPIAGTMFSQPASEDFTLYRVTGRNELPTHSDILDLLANGGCIGALLWIYGLYMTGRIAYRNLIRPSPTRLKWSQYGHTLGVMTLASILDYAVNPIFLTPCLAFLIWSNLGILLGLAVRRERETSLRAALA